MFNVGMLKVDTDYTSGTSSFQEDTLFNVCSDCNECSVNPEVVCCLSENSSFLNDSLQKQQIMIPGLRTKAFILYT